MLMHLIALSLCNSLREQTPIWSNLFQLHETILAVTAKELAGFEITATVEGSGVHSHRECQWWDEADYYSPLFIHEETKCYTNPSSSSLTKYTVEGTNRIQEQNPRLLVLFFKPNQAYFSPLWQQSDLWFSTVTYCCNMVRHSVTST